MEGYRSRGQLLVDASMYSSAALIVAEADLRVSLN
jgi:hypothetical protein